MQTTFCPVFETQDLKTEGEFVAFRQAPDSALAAPALLLLSMEVNFHAGCFLEAVADGVRYLTIPVKPKAASPTVAIPAD